MSKVFRPQGLSKKYMLKAKRRDYQYSSFRERDSYWDKKREPLNKKVIGRIFGRLHYLGSHSPNPIALQWHNAYFNFYRIHFSGTHSSVRYSNTYSAHSWL